MPLSACRGLSSSSARVSRSLPLQSRRYPSSPCVFFTFVRSSASSASHQLVKLSQPCRNLSSASSNQPGGNQTTEPSSHVAGPQKLPAKAPKQSGTKALPEKSESADWKTLKSVAGYLWPQTGKLKGRIALAALLMVGAKAVNVQVSARVLSRTSGMLVSLFLSPFVFAGPLLVQVCRGCFVAHGTKRSGCSVFSRLNQHTECAGDCRTVGHPARMYVPSTSSA